MPTTEITVAGHVLELVGEDDRRHAPQEVLLLDGAVSSRKSTFSGTEHVIDVDDTTWSVRTRALAWPQSEISVVLQDGEEIYRSSLVPAPRGT